MPYRSGRGGVHWGMRIAILFSALAVIDLAGPSIAAAQRVTFERTFEIGAPTLDIETDRGKIDVLAGEPGSIVVVGTVTVRVGWAVPADAEHLARAVAANPPIERSGDTLRIRIPDDGATRRAVTVSYQVRVPPGTRVRSVSESGETAIRGLTGDVHVRTQSGAIRLASLAAVDVASGSGAIDVDGITTRLQAESRSSGLRLRNVNGALTVTTQSGRVEASGAPGPWTISTGSSSVHLTIAREDFTLEASSRSGSLEVEGAAVDGSIQKRRIDGRVGRGGPLVKVTTGSGSIRLEVDSK